MKVLGLDKDVQAGVTILIGMVAGIICAAMELSLYNDGVWVDEFITGSITIADFMAVTIILWTLIGIVIAVLRS